MPSISVMNQADADNALNGLKFSKLLGPALISLWAAGVTVLDRLDFSIGDREVLKNADVNIEISADVVDTGRDQMLWAEPAEAGDLFMPVSVTTALGFRVLIDDV